MSEAKCEGCGKTYTPHHAYRNKTQACDGPSGYCAGVIDGRADRDDEVSDLLAKAERCEALEKALSESQAKVTEDLTISLDLDALDYIESVTTGILFGRSLLAAEVKQTRARIAELESERDEARRAAGHYRDGYDDAGPELKVLASNRFPWEATHD